MGIKLYKALDNEKRLFGYAFHCPGCGFGHIFYTEKRNGVGAIWSFNGNLEKPTFRASLLNTIPNYKGSPLRCHLLVTDGQIKYLKDCTHHLAGKTIEMEDIEL